MQKRDLQALNIGAFMNGMLSVFCTLRKSIFEPDEYVLEVTLRNEGNRALRNFLLTLGATPGIKFKNNQDLFGVCQLVENVSFLRTEQSKTLQFELKSILESFDGTLSISATPLKNSPASERLNVEMYVVDELRVSA
jgi:hypothetical protein